MGKKAIINAHVVLETGIMWDAILITEDEEILAYGKEIDIPSDAEIIDAEGAYVGPGFVDIHVHGINGKCTAFNPVEAAEVFLKQGTTSILSTPYYKFTFDEFMDSIKIIKDNMEKARTIRGIYMEGPYTNPDHGSFAYMNPWRDGVLREHYEPMIEAGGDLIKVWTIAPERDNIVDFLKCARDVNPDVKIAIGHTHATPEMVRALGSKYRPTILTHTGCATHISNATSRATRGSGVDEYSLQNPDVFCEMISDSCCIHVNADNQRLIIHNKGVERVVLVTDCTMQNTPNPPHLAHITDLNFDGKGNLCGSKMTMDKACRNVMESTNCGIAQAFIMASSSPAKAIGMYDEIGSVEVGKKADLVFVDDRFNVKKVMLRGEIV